MLPLYALASQRPVLSLGQGLLSGLCWTGASLRGQRRSGRLAVLLMAPGPSSAFVGNRNLKGRRTLGRFLFDQVEVEEVGGSSSSRPGGGRGGGLAAAAAYRDTWEGGETDFSHSLGACDT